MRARAPEVARRRWRRPAAAAAFPRLRPLRGGTMPACVAWSCEAVSDQRLKRAVKADVGKGGKAAVRKRHRVGWPEAHESHVVRLGVRVTQGCLRIGGQVAGEDGEGFIAVEM